MSPSTFDNMPSAGLIIPGSALYASLTLICETSIQVVLIVSNDGTDQEREALDMMMSDKDHQVGTCTIGCDALGMTLSMSHGYVPHSPARITTSGRLQFIAANFNRCDIHTD